MMTVSGRRAEGEPELAWLGLLFKSQLCLPGVLFQGAYDALVYRCNLMLYTLKQATCEDNEVAAVYPFKDSSWKTK